MTTSKWTAAGLEAYIRSGGNLTYIRTNGDEFPCDWDDFAPEAGESEYHLANGDVILPVHSTRENEYWINIFKVGDQYFRTMGEYDSWDGTIWDYAEIEEVTPVEKTVVEYVRVKS